MTGSTWFVAGAVICAAGTAICSLWQLRLRRIRRDFAITLGERSRVSRELHDTLLQNLVGLTLHLDSIADDVAPQSPRAQQQLLQMRKQLEECIREARRSILDLRSTTSRPSDLVTALRDVCDTAGPRDHLVFALDVKGEPRRCPDKVEEHLLRIGQEAVRNAVRHARASRIEVALQYLDGCVTLKVTDDGCGFDSTVPLETQGHHYGLLSMSERAKEIGASLEVRSQPNGGTEIRAVVPIAA
jgi:signal transduction histidine kinase